MMRPVVACVFSAALAACGDASLPASAPADGGAPAAIDGAAPCSGNFCIDRANRTFDLDSDGTPDTELRIGPCNAEAGSASCLLADSTLAAIGRAEWRFAPGPVSADLYGFGVHALGPHFGPLQAISVTYYDPSTFHPELVVIDPNAARPSSPVARFGAPPGWSVHDTWFGLVRGADGRRHPLLAPGRHSIPRTDGVSDWSFLCQFDVARIGAPDDTCGVGFRSVPTMFTAAEVAGTPANPANTFRHNGGFLADADGDGWDDVHLPYLWVIKTVSGRTGESLAASAFDVALQSEPKAPAQFHSGRFYGSFTPFSLNGTERVLVAAANAVGTFDDYNCNVSRYHALLERTPGAPTNLRLAWSHYDSFTKNTFQSPLNPANPVVTRPGDMLNGCLHRFSDSLYEAGDVPVTVYSRFASDTPANDCRALQVDEVVSKFAPATMAAWSACAAANFLPTRGSWSVDVRRLADGAPLSRAPNRYAWGTSKHLTTNQARVFLLEALPGKVRFDRHDEPVGALVVAALGVDAAWQTLMTFPGAGRPKVRIDYPVERGPSSTWGGLPELVTADRDGDGLADVALESGAWVGWSEKARAWVLK